MVPGLFHWNWQPLLIIHVSGWQSLIIIIVALKFFLVFPALPVTVRTQKPVYTPIYWIGSDIGQKLTWGDDGLVWEREPSDSIYHVHPHTNSPRLNLRVRWENTQVVQSRKSVLQSFLKIISWYDPKVTKMVLVPPTRYQNGIGPFSWIKMVLVPPNQPDTKINHVMVFPTRFNNGSRIVMGKQCTDFVKTIWASYSLSILFICCPKSLMKRFLN
jgi:hypothetical protein